ncbi:MAG: amidohydrolase family protein [Actinomycetes bacterium]
MDLSSIGVVDNHCHALDADQSSGGAAAWRTRFTESPHETMQTTQVADTAFYRRLMRSLASYLGLPPESEEQAILDAREQLSTEQLASGMYSDANIAGVVVDTGYPPPDRALARATFDSAVGTPRVDLLRLELLFQDLIATHGRYDDVVDDLDSRLSDVRAAGFAGFKSIAGYRTGLSIDRWQRTDIDDAFVSARADVAAKGSVRLGYKPLLDSLLHVCLARAAEQQLPVQFHIGYGDPDVDLRKASPLELRNIFEDPAYRAVPIVLLHGCWPYFREGAYLAAVYENAYLDLSYGIPFMSLAELTSMTRAAFGAAPFGKLMYSSDGTRVPELHWMGAHTGRRAIGRVLDELVSDGDLSVDQAFAAADQVLAGNAWRLYGLPGTRP